MKKYIGAILSIGTITMLFYTLFDLKNQVVVLQKEIDIVKTQRDSLHDENFVHQVELGRYELALDYLETINPKAALQLVNYMSHETE